MKLTVRPKSFCTLFCKHEMLVRPNHLALESKLWTLNITFARFCLHLQLKHTLYTKKYPIMVTQIDETWKINIISHIHITTTNAIIYRIVFQNDFTHPKKGMGCVENENNVIKEFPFSTEAMNGSQNALTICETFCSTEHKCWGCTAHCNTSCNYRAVSMCKNFKELPAVQDGMITKKPGNHSI